MLRLSSLITGDDYKMLKSDTPESRKKVNALATVLFIPVIIWFINGYLMVTTILEGSLQTALLVASVLALLIFLIEKNLIMAHINRPIKIFRYTLGIIIALLGAVILDEAIFKADVDQQLFQLNKQTIEQSMNNIDESYAANLESAQATVDLKYQAWQHALNEAVREADGSSGSGIKGVHSITRLKMETAEILKHEYHQAHEHLTNLQSRIDVEKAAQQQLIASSFDNGAMLMRIKALFQLVFSDWAMAIIYCLFTAFLFFMEFLVVFMKSAWPATNYERRLELIEEIGKRRMDKIKANDANHFDPSKVYANISNKQNIVNQSHALYN